MGGFVIAVGATVVEGVRPSSILTPARKTRKFKYMAVNPMDSMGWSDGRRAARWVTAWPGGLGVRLNPRVGPAVRRLAR